MIQRSTTIKYLSGFDRYKNVNVSQLAFRDFRIEQFFIIQAKAHDK